MILEILVPLVMAQREPYPIKVYGIGASDFDPEGYACFVDQGVQAIFIDVNPVIFSDCIFDDDPQSCMDQSMEYDTWYDCPDDLCITAKSYKKYIRNNPKFYNVIDSINYVPGLCSDANGHSIASGVIIDKRPPPTPTPDIPIFAGDGSDSVDQSVIGKPPSPTQGPSNQGNPKPNPTSKPNSNASPSPGPGANSSAASGLSLPTNSPDTGIAGSSPTPTTTKSNSQTNIPSALWLLIFNILDEDYSQEFEDDLMMQEDGLGFEMQGRQRVSVKIVHQNFQKKFGNDDDYDDTVLAK
ncbi:hypothetical protein HK103_001742 [Boothiomyces macroporosus]|uniref:Uncharacterized protein n=1 Tax=Boothiomyces macroporosus TaxID=261099 RepID=A0AAD5UJQ7_9FUNG|nr:hypothetical protein HK103_001742 [Boothiomyces macroporosus]